MQAALPAIAVLLAGGLLILKLRARWQHRFGAPKSALLETPAYRALLVLVLFGVLLVSVLPEAAFVLPALDAVGLDLVTILVAFELRHYLASMARLTRLPAWGRALVRRFGAVSLEPNPARLTYACMWPVIWLRTIKGTMPG